MGYMAPRTENQTTTAFNRTDRISNQIIDLLADAEGLHPRELPSLDPVIDLEVLDTLPESAASAVTVSFTVNGYDVIVTGNRSVVLDPVSQS